MRTEQEMLDLILRVAESDERVRAVGLNGSRANPNASGDMFQDFDIVYLVTEVDTFLLDHGWIDVFGERIIMQMPDTHTLFPSEPSESFAYLMQFTDGNRIDLTLRPMKNKDAYVLEDKLTIILLDKDRSLPQIQPPTDEEYWVKRPTPGHFADCCNEFWWVSTYVAKGLWRREMLYAQEHLNHYVRPMLIRMLEWQIGFETDFSVSAGKCGKYLDRYLSPSCWRELLATYAGGSYEDVWRALFAMGRLFRHSAHDVARRLDAKYPAGDDRRVTAFLRRIERLAPDAEEIV
jgi:aminoglycoside 6-adenylyltransferase